jgi:hypothetical protein
MSALSGYNLKQLLGENGIGVAPQLAVQPAKVLPATATGTLFTVSGAVVVLGLTGVISTVFSATDVNPTLGITNEPAAIAAAPAAAFTDNAVGDAIKLPSVLGGDLPASVHAKGSGASLDAFVVENTNITITTDATNTGAITWVLAWVPLNRKVPGSVSAP